MFFYSEIDTPTIMANRTFGTQSVNLTSPTSLNLADASDGDLLILYAYSGRLYGTQNTFLSSSASSNWYTLPDTKFATATLNYVGSLVQTRYGCSNNSLGTMVNSHFGDVKIIMKKITAAEIASGIKLSCIQEAKVSYMFLKGVTNYDFHRNSSGSLILQDFDSDYLSSTKSSSWPITNTNITNSTQKLFIAGQLAAGTISVPGATNIAPAGQYLFELNKDDLTGSSVPFTLNRGGRSYSFQYNSNTVYNPWATFLGIVIS